MSSYQSTDGPVVEGHFLADLGESLPSCQTRKVILKQKGKPLTQQDLLPMDMRDRVQNLRSNKAESVKSLGEETPSHAVFDNCRPVTKDQDISQDINVPALSNATLLAEVATKNAMDAIEVGLNQTDTFNNESEEDALICSNCGEVHIENICPVQTEKRSKKGNGLAEKWNWQMNINKRNRNSGKSYIGYKKVNERSEKVVRPDRKMGEECKSIACQKAKNRFCSDFSRQEREGIFINFWNMKDKTEKQNYVLSLVDMLEPARKRKREGTNKSNNRSVTYSYSLIKDNERIPVCVNMFRNSLGLKKGELRCWLKKSLDGTDTKRDEIIKRGMKWGKKKKIDTDYTHLDIFLDEIPKMESHYSSTTDSKIYVNSEIESKSNFYAIYMDWCWNKFYEPYSLSFFKKSLELKNIEIHTKKRDECDTCMAYEESRITLTVSQEMDE